MKLYELHRGELFYLAEQPLDIADVPSTERQYKLNNTDGMYSHVSDTDGNVYHFAAWTEVTKYDAT